MRRKPSPAPGRPTRGFSCALTLIGLVAVAVLSDCSATSSHDSNQTSSPPSSQSSRSSPDPSSTSALALADAKAVAAYLGMWRDFATAGHTSDWQSPLLSQYATGDALLQMSRGLYADHLNGYITKGAPVDHPTIKSATPASDPTTVLISDCGDSSTTKKYIAKADKPAPGASGGRQAIVAEVKKQNDGTWKVDRFAVEAVGTC